MHSEETNDAGDGGIITDQAFVDFVDTIRARGVRPNKIVMYSAHIMGSCPMSSDESVGAVNPEGELYGIRNLFVGDASVFPTAPGVYPMITIMAMSRRTAEFVAARVESQAPK